MLVEEACCRISAGQKVCVCVRVGNVIELNDGIAGSTSLELVHAIGWLVRSTLGGLVCRGTESSIIVLCVITTWGGSLLFQDFM